MEISDRRSPRVVEVFADVWCPFTHVGLRRLVEYRAEVDRPDVVVRVRAWPLELVNGSPLTVELVSEEIDALREHVAPDLFRGFDARRFPSTTLPALAVAASAYRRDDGTGEEVSLALRTALFEDGRDLGDPSELIAIARAAGLDGADPDGEQLVRADWEEGRRRGVTGSPHFFANGADFFCPTLAIERVDHHLQITSDPAAFAAFTAAAFGEPTPRCHPDPVPR